MLVIFSRVFVSLLLFSTLSPAGIQAPSVSGARHLTASNCSNAHGWMRISTGDIAGEVSCFSPEIDGGWANIVGSVVNGRDDISIVMEFRSHLASQTCRLPLVLIDFHEPGEVWSAYRVRNGHFGNCTIAQTFDEGHKIWKGHATATLVVVKGNTTSGSPRFLHTQKDSSGNPVTKTLEVEWEFDRLFSPDPRSAAPGKR